MDPYRLGQRLVLTGGLLTKEHLDVKRQYHEELGRKSEPSLDPRNMIRDGEKSLIVRTFDRHS